jgi:hypothetical protein
MEKAAMKVETMAAMEEMEETVEMVAEENQDQVKQNKV